LVQDSHLIAHRKEGLKSGSEAGWEERRLTTPFQ